MPSSETLTLCEAERASCPASRNARICGCGILALRQVSEGGNWESELDCIHESAKRDRHPHHPLQSNAFTRSNRAARTSLSGFRRCIRHMLRELKCCGSTRPLSTV